MFSKLYSRGTFDVHGIIITVQSEYNNIENTDKTLSDYRYVRIAS